MLYCLKCRTVFAEGGRACPACGSRKLRAARAQDLVFFGRVDALCAEKLCAQLAQRDWPFECRPYRQGRAVSLYDMEVLPDDKALYVPLEHLEEVRALAEEDGPQPPEALPEDGKFDVRRLVVACVGTVVFILFMMLLAWAVTRL